MSLKPTVNVAIANHFYACSTLILGNFVTWNSTSLKDFKLAILGGIERAQEPDNKVRNPAGLVIQALEGYKATDFAFVVASTAEYQESTERLLKSMGFKHTRRVSKNKNPHRACVFWVLEAPDFFKALSDLEAEAIPVKEYTPIKLG